MTLNRTRQHKVILYRLKQSFGMPVEFSYPTQNDYDVTTGDITRAFVTFTARKIIVLPAMLSRSFVYDLAYIAANKNFTTGGYFDSQTRNIIVQKSDIRNLTPTIEWVCTFKGRQYVFSNIEETENSEGFVIEIKHLEREGDQ